MSNVFTSGRGLNALDLTRLGAAIAGTYDFPSTAGGAVTVSSGMTVAVAAITGSTVTINGTLETTAYAGGTVTLDASDPTNPRIDSIYYDQTGAVDNAMGTAVAVTSTTGPVPPTLADDQIRVADIYVAAGTTTISAGNITDRRQPGSPTTISLTGLTQKYKSATQVFTTTTTFADVTASSGNLAFTAGANEVWRAEWWVYCTAGGTGGVKFQLTGPSAPTAVNVWGQVLAHTNDASASVAAIPPFTATMYSAGSSPASMVVTAFSTAILGINSGNSTGVDNTWHQSVGSMFRIVALIANGSNAGAVTLQAAQNSSNSTTTLGIGSHMIAQRIA